MGRQLAAGALHHAGGQVHTGALALRPAVFNLPQQCPGAAAHVQDTAVGNLGQLGQQNRIQRPGVAAEGGGVILRRLAVKVSAGSEFIVCHVKSSFIE